MYSSPGPLDCFNLNETGAWEFPLPQPFHSATEFLEAEFRGVLDIRRVCRALPYLFLLFSCLPGRRVEERTTSLPRSFASWRHFLAAFPALMLFPPL